MKYLVAVIALYFLSSLAVAQNSTYPDRIKLINGSLIKGTIIEDKVGEYVEIMITGKQTVRFKYDEIWWIKDGGYKHSGYQVKKPGYFIRTEIGIAIDKVEQPPWTNAGSYNNEYFTFSINNSTSVSELEYTRYSHGPPHGLEPKAMTSHCPVVLQSLPIISLISVSSFARSLCVIGVISSLLQLNINTKMNNVPINFLILLQIFNYRYYTQQFNIFNITVVVLI